MFVWLKKIFIYIAFLLIVGYLLHSHYIADNGACAEHWYYLPLTWRDYSIISALGIVALGASYLLAKQKTRFHTFIVEAIIYVTTIATICLAGNKILQSRQFDWPYKYNPTEKLHNIQK